MAAALNSAPTGRQRHKAWLLILIGACILFSGAFLGQFLPAVQSPLRGPAIETASVLPATTPGRVRVQVRGENLSPNSWLSLVREDRVRQSGRFIISTFGSVKALAFKGPYCFLAINPGGLTVVDLATPREPHIVSSLGLPGTPWDIAITGDVACLATWAGGLQLIDIQDPLKPAILASMPINGQAISVAATEDLAFVGTYRDGLQIVDIGNPVQPRLLGKLEVKGGGKINQIVVKNRLLYLATDDAGLLVVDVTNPARPNLTASLALPNPAKSLAIQEELCLVVDNRGDLHRFSLADLRHPRLVQTVHSSVTESTNVKIALEATAGRAFLGFVNGMLIEFDLSAPGTPPIGKSIQLPSGIKFIKMHDGLVYVGLGAQGLAVIDPSEWSWSTTSNWQFGRVHDLILGNGVNFLATYPGGLVISDQVGPGEGHPVGRPHVPKPIIQMALERNRLFLASTEGLSMVEVGDPTQPHLRWSLPGLNSRSVSLAGGRLLVGTSDKRLLIFDQMDQERPRKISELALPGLVKEIQVKENRVYLTCLTGGMVIVDLTDPFHPTLLGTYNRPWPFAGNANTMATDVVVVEQTAFIAYGREGLQLVDVSDPENPRFIGRTGNLKIPIGLAVAGTRLYVLDAMSSLTVFDIKNPARPIEMVTIPLSRRVLAIAVKGGLIYLSSESEGVLTLPEPILGKAERLANSGALEGELSVPTNPGSYSLEVLGPGGFAIVPEAFRLPAPKQEEPAGKDQKR